MIFAAEEMVDSLTQLHISHVVWIPDSDLGRWEAELESSPITLLRVCREGEAWPLAAGLWLGGQRPLVIMQSTGMFESGDALRNVVHDLQVPVLAIIGARNWLNPTSRDSAKRFAEPILSAWGVDHRLIEHRDHQSHLVQFFSSCRAEVKAGIVLLAE